MLADVLLPLEAVSAPDPRVSFQPRTMAQLNATKDPGRRSIDMETDRLWLETEACKTPLRLKNA